MSDKQSEHALELPPHHILRQMPGIVWTTGMDLRLTSISGAAIDQAGMPLNVALGVALSDFFQTSDEDAAMIAAHRRALAGETVTADLHWAGRAFRASIGPFRNDRGEVRGSIGIASEDAESIDEGPRQTDDWYRSVVEEQADLIARFTPDTRLTYVNAAYARYFGTTQEALLGESLLELVAEEHRPITQARLQRLGPQSPVVENEERVVLPSGEVRWQHWLNRAIFDAQGRIVEIQATGRDITERKRLEDSLRQSEERFRLAFDEAPVGMAICVGEGIIARVNQALCRMSDYQPEELVGRHVRDFMHPDDRELSAGQVQKLFTGEIQSFTLERRYLAKGGRVFWAQATTAAARHPDGKLAFALGILEDITQRKQAQEALERERQTLRHMLRAGDHERQLIAYEIHDGLAQHLAGAIMQFQTCEHLRANEPENAGTAHQAGMQMLRQAHFEARRLISGVRPPILDESGITAAIAHLVHEQRRSDGPAIEFVGKVSFDRLPKVVENAIYRVAQEAMGNACKHSRSPKVRVSLIQEGDRVRLEVHDWGVGFSAEAVGKDRFGLEGIRERARLLGGTATIESRPGRGTVVAMVLPLMLEDDEEQ